MRFRSGVMGMLLRLMSCNCSAPILTQSASFPESTPLLAPPLRTDDVGQPPTPVKNYDLNNAALPRSGLVQWPLCKALHSGHEQTLLVLTRLPRSGRSRARIG